MRNKTKLKFGSKFLLFSFASVVAVATIEAQDLKFYQSPTCTGEEQTIVELINNSRIAPEFAYSKVEAEYSLRGIPFSKKAQKFFKKKIHSKPPFALTSGLQAACNYRFNEFINDPDFFFSHSLDEVKNPTEWKRILAVAEEGRSASWIAKYSDGVNEGIGGLYLDLTNGWNWEDFREELFLENEGKHYHEFSVRTQGVGDVRNTISYVFEKNLSYATGVAFTAKTPSDLYNSNNAIPGIRVTSSASSYFTETSPTGGYTLPLDKLPLNSAGEMVTISFTDLNGKITSQSFTTKTSYPNSAPDNIKADYKLINPSQPDYVTLEVGNLPYQANFARGVTHGWYYVRRLSADYSKPLKVFYKINGNAEPGVDYAPLSGHVKIPRNREAALIPVMINSTQRDRNVVLKLEETPQYKSATTQKVKMRIKKTVFP